MELVFMKDLLKNVTEDMDEIVSEWREMKILRPDDIFVLGCSTSEVAGKDIGSSGSEEIGAVLFQTLQELVDAEKIHLAFQCCEHLNRALVVERATMVKFGLEEVSVIPVPSAGGSMASFAYKNFTDPVVVETIKADAAMDVGETLIGMHLKPVAVPLRFKQRTIGNARVNAARTRPKLIGGIRAVYE